MTFVAVSISPNLIPFNKKKKRPHKKKQKQKSNDDREEGGKNRTLTATNAANLSFVIVLF